MERGARLYEKFAAFINDMEDLGKCLRGANQSYEDAKKKLSDGRGNLVDQVEKLRKLGVKPKFSKSSKPIPAGWLASTEDEDEVLALAASDAETSTETET
jgi:DNA recombination protein RmuC